MDTAKINIRIWVLPQKAQLDIMIEVYINFGEVSMNSLEDMLRTKFWDGRTDGQNDRYIPPLLRKRGYKN